jgi:hypothetical protein
VPSLQETFYVLAPHAQEIQSGCAILSIRVQFRTLSLDDIGCKYIPDCLCICQFQRTNAWDNLVLIESYADRNLMALKKGPGLTFLYMLLPLYGIALLPRDSLRSIPRTLLFPEPLKHLAPICLIRSEEVLFSQQKPLQF